MRELGSISLAPAWRALVAAGLVVSLASVPANGESWSTLLDGDGCGRISRVVADPDGGAFLAGSVSNFGSGEADGWLARLDSTGQVLWHQAIGTPGSDSVSSLVLREDGRLGVVITHRLGLPTGATAAVLEPTGELVSQHRVGGDFLGVANAAGGFHFAGSVDHGDADDLDCPRGDSSWPIAEIDSWVFALTDSGAVAWSRSVESPCSDRVAGLAALPDGSVALGVLVHWGNIPFSAISGHVLRLDATGEVELTWQLGEIWNNDSGYLSLSSGPDGSIAAMGRSGSSPWNDLRLWAASYSASGDLVIQDGRDIGQACLNMAWLATALPGGGLLSWGGNLAAREADGDGWSRRYWFDHWSECDARLTANFCALDSTLGGQVVAAGYPPVGTGLLVERFEADGELAGGACAGRSSLTRRVGGSSGSPFLSAVPITVPQPAPVIEAGRLVVTSASDSWPCEQDCRLEICDEGSGDEDQDGLADCLDSECAFEPHCADADTDGDGTPNVDDCAPLEPYRQAPRPVGQLRVRLDAASALSLSWRHAWGADTYDVVGFPLRSPAGGPDLAAAECLASDVSGETWLETEPRGDSGYLVRGRGVCGVGPWEVTALDAAGSEPLCP